MYPEKALFQLHRPVGVVEELLPRAIALVAEVDVEHGAVLGLDGLLDEGHAGLLGGPAALFHVAVGAGTDDVVPGRLAAHAAGGN